MEWYAALRHSVWQFYAPRPVLLSDFWGCYWYCCAWGVRLCLCGTGPLTGPLSIPEMICIIWVNVDQRWDAIDMGAPEDSEKNLKANATFSTTDTTCIDLTANPGLRGEKLPHSSFLIGPLPQTSLSLSLYKSLHFPPLPLPAGPSCGKCQQKLYREAANRCGFPGCS
jgi:hypothetical protein